MKTTLLILFLVLATACAHKPAVVTEVKPSVVTGFAPVNGLEMYYEVHGDKGEPIVLIHGGGSNIDVNFKEMIPLLAKTRKVIAVEEQGHGHTKAIKRPFTFENSADDVAAVLKYLKIEKADIFGFSNGGNIAMQVAIRHPEQVNKIIVASGMFERGGMIPGFWDMMKNAKLEHMPKDLQEADLKINPDPKHLVAMFEQDSKRMQTFKDWPAKSLKSIKAPALILAGDQDVVTPEHSLKMFRLIPKSRLVILQANHGDYLNEAETVNIINEFLNTK